MHNCTHGRAKPGIEASAEDEALLVGDSCDAADTLSPGGGRQCHANPATTSTAQVTRGAMRLLVDLGYAPLTEVSLTNGRRVDILGLDRRGKAVVVEVKSCAADYQSDRKWQEYLAYCEEFYFAVDADFPRSLLETPDSLPDVAGLIIADAYGGDIIRPAAVRKVNAARRKALTLKAARAGAHRLAEAALKIPV